MAKEKALSSVTLAVHDDSAAFDEIIEHLEPAAKVVVKAGRLLILKDSPEICPSANQFRWTHLENETMPCGEIRCLRH